MSDDERKPSLADQLAHFQQPMFTPFDPDTGKGLERALPMGFQTQIEGGEYVAPGHAAEHAYGVMFRADHETLGDGMCRQARAHAVALSKHMPVLLSTIQGCVRRDGQVFTHAGDDMLEPIVLEEVGALRRASIGTFVAAIYHTQVHAKESMRLLLLPQHVRTVIGASERLLARSIVYVPWERSTVAPELIEVMNKLGQVWLQCRRNRDVFVAAGLDPARIRMIYPAFDPGSAVAELPVVAPVPRRGRRYYSIGKWEPRKAQHALIGAFLAAHGPTDDASLTIKTSFFGEWQNYPSHRESLGIWLATPEVRARGWNAETAAKVVRIYDRTFTDEQMTLLHRMHNIYVSASHAEGWDYPAFDAVTAGNTLVHVGFGGTEDYAPGDAVLVEGQELGPVHPGYGWESDAQWATYPFERLVAALLEARVPERRLCRPQLAEHYGAPAMGRAMAKAVMQLLQAAYTPEEVTRFEESWRSP